MTATCIKVTYEPSDFSTCQGVKNDGKRPSSASSFGKFTSIGHGIGTVCSCSKLILYIKYQNEDHEIWVGKFFKEEIGRLTKKRVNAIRKCMPPSVQVHVETSDGGTNYFVVEDADLQSWLANVKKILKI